MFLKNPRLFVGLKILKTKTFLGGGENIFKKIMSLDGDTFKKFQVP